MRRFQSAVALALLVAACGPAPPPAAPIANVPPAEVIAPAPALVAGELRLEGQVLDGAERPLAGAEVALETRPRAVTTSEADGYFAFDGLAAGDYTIVAHSDDRRTARVSVALTRTSEPVILRVR
jgi:hypothetical protein